MYIIQMVLQYAIRIDDRNNYVNILRDVLKSDRFFKHLAVRHVGKKSQNIHYHICIETDYKDSALRKELKKHFTLGKGNGHMAIKPWDGNEKALSYMFHDKEHIIISTDYNNDDIEKFKVSNEEIQTKLKANGVSSVLSKTITRLRESKRIPGHESICFAIWDVLREQGDWFPNKFQLERWIMKVESELCEENEHSWKRCKSEWYRQMFNR